ncbi:MAG: hypothetical protein K8T20_18745 [Planctomycetes bacterium]|nr:hypothetical protein [Planctomycetota bacterium]
MSRIARVAGPLLSALACLAILPLLPGCASNPGPVAATQPDPYTECLAASGTWKTLLATYRMESRDAGYDVTFAVERGGRIAIRGASVNAACIITGSRLYLIRQDDLDRTVAGQVDFGTMVDLAGAIESGSEWKPHEPDEDSPLNWSLDWSCTVDHDGNAKVNLVVRASREQEPLFGWLDRLRGGAGVTVTSDEGKFTIDGPTGRYEISRATGLLISCGRLPPAGAPISLTLTSLKVDVPLGDDLFDVSGDPSAPKDLRRYFAEYFINQILFDSLAGEMDPAVRRQKCLSGIASFYGVLWTAEERQRVVGVARQHIKQVAEELRKSTPDVPEEDIWKAACITAGQILVDEIKGEIDEDSRMFFRVTLLESREEWSKFWDDYSAAVAKALILPIVMEAIKRE